MSQKLKKLIVKGVNNQRIPLLKKPKGTWSQDKPQGVDEMN